MTMKTKGITKDSYLFSGTLKATAAAVLILLAGGAHAGSLLEGMGRWFAETGAAVQADTAYSSDSGSPAKAALQNAPPFDASALKVSSATTDDARTASPPDCQGAGGGAGCVQDPVNDPALSGVGGTGDGTAASGDGNNGSANGGAFGGGRGSDGATSASGNGGGGNNGNGGNNGHGGNGNGSSGGSGSGGSGSGGSGSGGSGSGGSGSGGSGSGGSG
jgi:hypothetical protein